MKTPLTFLLALTFLFLFGCSKKTGEEKEYWDNGKLKSETHYKNWKKEGLEIYWYESGQKKYEVPFKNGVRLQMNVDKELI